jgi:hypothetical protein
MAAQDQPALDLANRLALGIADTARALGVSEAHLRNHLHDVPHFHLGNRVLFPIDSLREWASKQAAGEQDQADRDARDLLQALE